MGTSEVIEGRTGREAAFEPLLDRLAEIFDPDRTPWRPRPAGYEHCEAKRLAIARAAAQNHDGVREHAGLVLRAIVNDTSPSGNRQLIEVALRAIGTRAVMETLLGYVESGDIAEQYGAAMALYWAHPAVAYDWRERREHQAEFKAETRDLADLRAQAQQICLRVFIKTDDPDLRANLSLRFTLDPTAYPAIWTPVLARALDIALTDPDRFDRLLRTRASDDRSEQR